jgi:hypothetical protein
MRSYNHDAGVWRRKLHPAGTHPKEPNPICMTVTSQGSQLENHPLTIACSSDIIIRESVYFDDKGIIGIKFAGRASGI